MAPVAQFMLPCGVLHPYFYRVQFYATPEDMHGDIAKLKGRRNPGDKFVRALCLRYEVGPQPTPAGKFCHQYELGTLFFVKGDAGPEVVVHELTHAVVGWARRTKTDALKESKRMTRAEENFATTMQFMFEQFYEKAPAALAEAA